MRTFFNHFVYGKSWGNRVARHLTFWLVYFWLFRVMYFGGSTATIFMVAGCFLPVNLAFVYYVLYGLSPKLLMRFAYWPFFCWYCVGLFACLSLDFFWGEYVVFRLWPVAPYDHPTSVTQVLKLIFDPAQFSIVNVMAGLGVAIEMYKFWRAEVWMKLQMEQEKARTELELLKGQLHPQFLYDTLTHLRELVTAGSEKAPDLLLRLSAILSYNLYECRSDEVPLERELAVCREYIVLEQERQGGLDVSVDFFGSLTGKRIAPMILLPFIANAFAKRTDDGGGQWMAFECSVNGEQLLMRILDGREPVVRKQSWDTGGLERLDSRLRLVYPGRYSLTQKENEDAGIFSLTIDLEATKSLYHAPLSTIDQRQ